MLPNKTSTRSYRCKRTQKGEAELLVFGIVLVIAGLISGTIFVIEWVKRNKYSEREARQKLELAEKAKRHVKPRRDPAEYMALCQKPAWTLLQTKYPCEVLPESYGELFLMPDE